MSTETKHTPGPWRVGKSFGSVVSDAPVPGINGSDDVEYYGGHLVAESVAPNNARLIAESPRMLSVLQKLCAMQEDGDVASWVEEWDEARAVIAEVSKATGAKP